MAAYWRLYASRALLNVRRKQYDLAVAQWKRARRQAKAGLIAEVDIVRAESGVADQVEQIILAENDVRQRTRDLKRILNRPDLGMETLTQIIPATPPNSVEYNLDPSRLVAAALSQRMELLDIELQILSDTASVSALRETNFCRCFPSNTPIATTATAAPPPAHSTRRGTKPMKGIMWAWCCHSP